MKPCEHCGGTGAVIQYERPESSFGACAKTCSCLMDRLTRYERALKQISGEIPMPMGEDEEILEHHWRIAKAALGHVSERIDEIKARAFKAIGGTDRIRPEDVNFLLRELERVQKERDDARKFYGPAGLRAVSSFIEECDHLRAENSRLKSHLTALHSAAIRVLQAQDDYEEGDLVYAGFLDALDVLRNAVESSKPLSSAAVPNPPHPAEQGSGT